MTISLAEFFGRLQEQPVLLGAALLILGVVLVNGWTDAPGAIATCISTRPCVPVQPSLWPPSAIFWGLWS